MTLDEKISLVEQMIKENRDYTIADYLELVREIDQIKPVTPIKKIMPVVFRQPPVIDVPIKTNEDIDWRKGQYSNSTPFGISKPRKSRAI